jgi:hypothetical protein
MTDAAAVAFLWTTAARANAHWLQSATFSESPAILEPADPLQLDANSTVPDFKHFQRNGCVDITRYTSACHLDDLRAVGLKDKTFDFHFVVL